jgi:pimeloyl-ACP methyl ester carboxylesterase
MEYQCFAEKEEQIIEYYSNKINTQKTPVIISMGNWEPAFRGLPLLNTINDRLCLVLSYRGRGRSFTPEKGWDWKDHARDLEMLFETTHLRDAIFIAFSKGVSYTLGFLEKRPGIAKGLILIDYPAIHSLADEGYAGFWHEMYYNGFYLKDHINRIALEGIEKESTEKDFYDTVKALKCPVAVFAGRDQSSERPSNLDENDIEKFKAANPKIKFINFWKSGHMILDEEFEKASNEIGMFLNDLE